MKLHHFFIMLVAMTGIAACESYSATKVNTLATTPLYPSVNLPVMLTVQGDKQGNLREFRLNNDASHYRAYIEAMPNERYRLRVVNNSEQRVGLVIAVDGLNIISGKKSYLANNERMYILNPHDSADYDGWRTTTSQTNRFYFTEANNSYAAAWGDTSAMGVIAMAVYPERPRPEVYYNKDTTMRGVAESSRMQAPALASAPGTGYGENSYSPTVSVSFEPTPEPMEKIVLKYEWRETLCSKGVLPECSAQDNNGGNRLWQNSNPNENGGFAPPPPAH
jgi:hypothetical protein